MSACCPFCTSDDVYRSRRGNPRWQLPLRLFVLGVRCRNCGTLFHVRSRLLLGPVVVDRSGDALSDVEHEASKIAQA